MSKQVDDTLIHLLGLLSEVVDELNVADFADYALTLGEQAELLEYANGIHRILWPGENQ
jgi:hypothetical protein